MAKSQLATVRYTRPRKQQDCRYEVPFPGLHMIVFCVGSDLVSHRPSKRCGVECCHPMLTCGEFSGTIKKVRDTGDALLDRMMRSDPLTPLRPLSKIKNIGAHHASNK